MQELIDEPIIDIHKEEVASPKQLFFAFLCCCRQRQLSKHNFFLYAKNSSFLLVIRKKYYVFYHCRLPDHNIFVCEEQLIFSGDQ